MDIIELIILLIIAAVVGFIGQSLGGFKRDSLLLAIILGFVGALIGSWLAQSTGLPEILSVNVGGVSFPIVWAIIGAAIFVALVRFLGGRGSSYGWLTPPTRPIFIISVVLAGLALLISSGIVSLSLPAFTMMSVAYIVLLLGNLFKGL